MNIAIHHREGTFSDRWIEYCEEKKISYTIVNCYENDIIKTFREKGITHLLWQLNHFSKKELDLFPNVMNSAELMNIKVFPNFNTRWHFDNKISQKYLLESIQAPLVKTDVFYDKAKALAYIKGAKFPLVFKLKRGAGASNVFLLKDGLQAKKYISRMFNEGIVPINSVFTNLKDKVRLAKQFRSPFKLIKKIIDFSLKVIKERKASDREKNYVYFQEFLPKNDFDTRVVVIGNKAFAIRRFNRENDFRASGSGKIDYDHNKIDLDFVSIAFDVCKKIGVQCLAFDFIYGFKRNPKIVEVCYAFSMLAYDKCEGYWEEDLTFIKGKFNPQYFMIEDLILTQ